MEWSINFFAFILRIFRADVLAVDGTGLVQSVGAE
jgi:hypothetical protein